MLLCYTVMWAGLPCWRYSTSLHISSWEPKYQELFVYLLRILDGGFKSFGFSPRNLRKWSNLTIIFLNGLKPPTRYWCFLRWWYPQNTPKMIIFSRKTSGCWVPPILGTPHMLVDSVSSSKTCSVISPPHGWLLARGHLKISHLPCRSRHPCRPGTLKPQK